MTDIVTWPPALRSVGIRWGREWPMRSGVGFFDGKRYAASAGPTRRLADIDVPALTSDARDGAGYSASVAQLIDGGIGLVRLPCPPVNWYRDTRAAPYSLTGPAMAGTVTTSGGYDAIALTGLTPGSIVCRAHDVIGSYVSGVLDSTAYAVATVRAALDGTATIKLFSALPAGTIRIGAPETIVCEAMTIPYAAQPLDGQWVYSWRFREVLASELPGSTTEVNPWP